MNRAILLTTLLAASLGLTCPMDGQVCTAREQKISATDGSFGIGLNDWDNFGSSVSSLGDLNGDGIGDLAVGTRQDDDGGPQHGAVWILFLNTDGTVKLKQKISETAGGFGGDLDDEDQFGWSVASLGDLDGDGVGDLAVGAIRDDDGGINRGAVWILFLDNDGTVKSEQKISETAGSFGGTLNNSGEFGCSVSSLGDLDGDGVLDIAVGARGTGHDGEGAVWILFLNTNGTVKSEQEISETAGGFGGVLDSSDNFGNSVSWLGDLDGDGIGDLAVGARGDDDGGCCNRGAVWILFLNANGTVKSEQKISETAGGFGGDLDANDQFGLSLASSGDLNGDGIGDLVVGAPEDDDGGTNHGAIWLLFLNTNGTVKSERKISGTVGRCAGSLDVRGRFGWSMTSMGDLDGSGFCDLAVGAPDDDDGGSSRGAVWVMFLGQPLELVGPSPGIAGVPNTLTISGAEPNGPVTFYAGYRAGSNMVACIGGMVDLEIRNIKAAAGRMADSSGVASFTSHVPAKVSGRTFRFQAVDIAVCRLSNLVVLSFP